MNIKESKTYPANFKKITTLSIKKQSNIGKKYISVRKLQSKSILVMECFHPISRIIDI